jgi:hypothetical protein
MDMHEPASQNVFVYVPVAEPDPALLATIQKGVFLASVILTIQNDWTHEP